MSDFIQPTEADPLDNQSYCNFCIVNNEIKLNTDFKSYDDMLELLNVIVNTDFVLESITEGMEDEQKSKIISDLRSMRRQQRPFVTPLSVSSSE